MPAQQQLPPEVSALLSLVYKHHDRRVAAARDEGLLFAHYTSAENALKILAGRALWLRNAAVMNDHSEIEHGRAILDGLIEGELGRRLWATLDAAHDGVSNDIRSRYYHNAHYAREMTFMSSLCEHEHSEYLGRLSMWRAYGGPTAGVALVFKSDVVIGAGMDFGVYASPVLYGGLHEVSRELAGVIEALEANAAVLGRVDRGMVADVLSNALRFALLSTKHKGFQEEREWRLLCMTDELTTGTPIEQRVESVGGIPQRICVLSLPEQTHPDAGAMGWERLLERIIIGPSVYPHTIKDALETVLKRNQVSRWDQLVEISEIPLRQ